MPILPQILVTGGSGTSKTLDGNLPWGHVLWTCVQPAIFFIFDIVSIGEEILSHKFGHWRRYRVTLVISGLKWNWRIEIVEKLREVSGNLWQHRFLDLNMMKIRHGAVSRYQPAAYSWRQLSVSFIETGEDVCGALLWFPLSAQILWTRERPKPQDFIQCHH